MQAVERDFLGLVFFPEHVRRLIQLYPAVKGDNRLVISVSDYTEHAQKKKKRLADCTLFLRQAVI